MSANSSQLATFLIDDLYFGVDVQKVQEVIRHQDLTRVPLAPAVVRGLMNLRGQIVTAIDLRQKLGLAGHAADHAPMNVVVRSDDAVVSLLVDEIDEVIEVEDSELEPPPHTLTGPIRDHVRGVYKLPGRLLLVLDEEKASSVAPDLGLANA